MPLHNLCSVVVYFNGAPFMLALDKTVDARDDGVSTRHATQIINGPKKANLVEFTRITLNLLIKVV